MKNELSIIVGIAAVLLLVGSILGIGFLTGAKDSSSSQSDSELAKYRSQNIPEECRIPESESDVDWWKQHLSHHQQTWYCLEYYGTSIEEMKGGA